MKAIKSYFAELRQTLRRIERHLEKLSSTVSTSYGRGYPAIRTGKNQFDE